MRLSQLPNVITILRIAAVPVLILLLEDGRYGAALAVFAVAGISDALDGLIAKRFNFVSRLGAILDPLADKLLLVSAYVMLAYLGQLPFWLVLAVVSRDALIVSGYLVYTSLHGPVQMRPSVLSKLNTFFQIALIVLLMAKLSVGVYYPVLVSALVYTVLVTTIGSGVHYLWTWLVLKDVQPGGGEKG